MTTLTQTHSQQRNGILAMFGAATIWGTWVLVIAVISLPSIYILPVTFTASGIVLLTYVLSSGRRNAFFRIFKDNQFIRLVAWVALLEVTQSSLYVISYSIAIQDGGSVVIPIIRSLAGIITPVLATFSSNEQFSKHYLFYGALSSLGAILIFSQGGITAGEDLSYVALVMVVISVVIRGWFYLEQRKVAQEMQARQYDATHVMTAHLIVSSFVLISVSLIYTAVAPAPVMSNLLEQLAFLAVCGLIYTALASTLRLVAMKQISAQQSIIIMYFEPFLGVMLSILFLGETVTIGFFVGAALILFSAGSASLHKTKASDNY